MRRTRKILVLSCLLLAAGSVRAAPPEATPPEATPAEAQPTEAPTDAMPAETAPVGDGDEYEELWGKSLEELLDTTIVSTTLTEQSVTMAPGVVTVITAEEMEQLGLRTLADALELVSGVTVLETQLHGQLIAVRGSSNPANILVTLDGQPMNDFYDGSVLTRLPLHNIERVEVIRGPGSALYGTNAFSAVVSLFTRRPPPPDQSQGEDTSFSATVAAGGDLLVDDAVGGGGWVYGRYLRSFEGWSVRAAADYLLTTGPRVEVDTDLSLSRTGFDGAIPGDAAAWLQVASAHLALGRTGLLRDDDELDISTTFVTRETGAYFGPQRYFAPDGELSRSSFWSAIEYRTRLTDLLQLQSRWSFALNRTNNEIQRVPDGFTELANPDGVFTDGKLARERYFADRTGVQLTLTHELDRNTFLLGAAAEYNWMAAYQYGQNFASTTAGYEVPRGAFGNHDDVPLDQAGRDRTVLAVFAQNQAQFTDDLWVTVGGRYDHYSDFGGTVNPRAAVVWRAHPDLSFKLLYGRAFRAPTFRELYDSTSQLPTGETLVPNKDLEPETTDTAEFDVQWSIADVLLVRANGFWTRTDNPVDLDPHFNFLGQQYVNFPGLRILGFETELELVLAPRYRFMANVSWFTAEQLGEGIGDVEAVPENRFQQKEIRDTPAFRLNAAFLLRPIDTLEIGGRYAYTSATEPNARFFYERVARSFDRPSFHGLNLVLRLFTHGGLMEWSLQGTMAINESIPIQWDRDEELYRLSTGQLRIIAGAKLKL